MNKTEKQDSATRLEIGFFLSLCLGLCLIDALCPARAEYLPWDKVQSGGAVTKSGKTRKECAKLNDRLESVREKLRQGYTVRQGAKLEAKKRDLQKKIFKKCR